MLPEIQLYDPTTIARLVATHDPSASDLVIQSSTSDHNRATLLRSIRDSPLGSMRALAVGTPDMLERLDELAASAPNFCDVLGVVRRAAVLSMCANTSLSIPPLLLLGPPGVGKTYVARKIAEALDVPMAEYSFASGDDPGALAGHSQSWRAARPGMVAITLLEELCASPVIFIDELDKASPLRDENPTDCLHALLEPGNAARFCDQFLEFPMRADGVIWILTANDTTALRPSLLDRMLVLQVAAPTPAQQRAVVLSIYDEVILPYALVIEREPDGPVFARLGAMPPRQIRRALQLALPFAMAANRRRITPADIDAAERLMQMSARRPIGFTCSLG